MAGLLKRRRRLVEGEGTRAGRQTIDCRSRTELSKQCARNESGRWLCEYEEPLFESLVWTLRALLPIR